jgi:predicted O-methyltransferase YrrM
MIDTILTEESNLKALEISNTILEKTFHHHYHILYDLRTLLGEDKKTYVEIGTYAGGSASLVSSHPYQTESYSIDIGYPINPEIPKANVQKYKNKDNDWTYILGDSQKVETLNKLKTYVDGIDILFIDGDHSANGVNIDFNLYSPLVKSGGYLWFDDYLDFKYSPQVKPAVDNIVNEIDKNVWEVIGMIPNKYGSKPKEKENLNGFLLRRK